MNSFHDHLVPALLAVVVMALPLLLLTAGVLAIALISACSTGAEHRRHSRNLLKDLTSFGVRVLRR